MMRYVICYDTRIFKTIKPFILTSRDWPQSTVGATATDQKGTNATHTHTQKFNGIERGRFNALNSVFHLTWKCFWYCTHSKPMAKINLNWHCSIEVLIEIDQSIWRESRKMTRICATLIFVLLFWTVYLKNWTQPKVKSMNRKTQRNSHDGRNYEIVS